jgi:plasmid stability protein
LASIPRKTLAALILVAGVIWSLPMQPGRDNSFSEPSTYSATDIAEFRISSYRTTLTLTGHTRSELHERRLADAIREHFPAQEIQQEFHPLGVAPAWWDEATIGLVSLLADLESPDAHLTRDALRVRAAVRNEADVDEQLQILRRRLPPSIILDTQFVAIDEGATVALSRNPEPKCAGPRIPSSTA